MLYKLCLCYDCFHVYTNTIHLTAFVHILCCFYFDSIFNVCFICSINILMMNMLCFLQFGIRSAVLNAELPQNSRLHIIEVSFLHGFYQIICNYEKRLDRGHGF
jgi:hypothetical protein